LLKNIFKRLLWIFIPLVLIFGIIFHQRNLIITEVDCHADPEPCPGEISQALSDTTGGSLLLLNRRQLSQLLTKQTGATKVIISSKLPGVLKINLTLPNYRLPIAIVSTNYFNQQLINLDLVNKIISFIKQNQPLYQTINQNGQFISTAEKSSLYLLGSDFSSSQLASFSATIKTLNQSGISYKEVYYLHPNLIAILANNQVVVFDVQKSFSEQILSLQQLHRAVTIKDSQFIDLRFSRPITK